jgi:hypothetical protein
MTRTRFAAPIWLCVAVLVAHTAAADDTQDAAKHFQRGVSLFSEADYKAALVEFKRAYGLSPNTQVLFNVGETQFQLQDYAAALTTFQRFLAEAGPTDPQRAEVERNMDVLRARVGHITVTTVPAGADVSVDDHPLGKTPLSEAVLVSIGHRQVSATMAGRPAVSRWVDVAADDDVAVTLQLPAPTSSGSATRAAFSGTGLPAPQDEGGGGATLRTLGWIGTGALAASAITFGVLASHESSTLATARNTFPTQASTLSHEASLTGAYSILADSLGAAALVLGGITLFSTLTSSPSAQPARGSTGTVRVGLGPGSARLDVTF